MKMNNYKDFAKRQSDEAIEKDIARYKKRLVTMKEIDSPEDRFDAEMEAEEILSVLYKEQKDRK